MIVSPGVVVRKPIFKTGTLIQLNFMTLRERELLQEMENGLVWQLFV